MTNSWARMAKWEHNLIFFFFFLHQRGCKRILFCSYFKGLCVRKCWNTSLSRHSSYSIIVLPGSVYSCTVRVRSQVLPLNVSPHLSDIWILVEDRKTQWKLFFVFLGEELEHSLKWSESDSVSITATIYESHTHIHTHTHLLAGELVLRRTKIMKWPVQYCCYVWKCTYSIIHI